MSGPVDAESVGWSCGDGSAQGVTLTAQGDELMVTLHQPGEYTVWLVSEEHNFNDPIYIVDTAPKR